MKLYSYYRSSASYRIRIVLNVKGVEWEYVAVALDKGEQMDDAHRTRNPMKLVPVLDTGEEQLAQSVAIAEFLENRFPDPPLLPGSETDRARVRELVQIIASDIQPIGNLRILKYLAKNLQQDEAGVQRWVQHWVRAGFEAFETRVAQHSSSGQFSFGDTMTLADVFLMPQAYNAERFGMTLDEFPTIAGIVRHCAEIPAVAAAHPSRQPDAPA